MKSSTRNMLLAAAVAPVALFGALPAHADVTDGPSAALLQDATSQTPVADLVEPVVSAPTKVVDGLLTTAEGAGKVRTSRTGAQDVVANLGAVVSDALGLKMDGLSARCVTTSQGTLKAVTRITGGTADGRSLPEVPVANMTIPLLDGALATFNKQSRDAKGALSVTGLQVTDRAGKVSNLAVAKCVPAARIVSSARKAKGHDPLSALLGGLLGAPMTEPVGYTLVPVTGQFGGVTDISGLTKGLPVGDPMKTVNGLTRGLPAADLTEGLPVGGAMRPAGALPDVVPLGLGDTLSGLLGGLPGTPGTLPAGVYQVLPELPVG